MIADTSLTAFDLIQNSLGERQLQVYGALEELQFATNTMIANHLKLPINTITPRCSELRKKGFVERSHISYCPITKNRAQYWKLKINSQEEKNNGTIRKYDIR